MAYALQFTTNSRTSLQTPYAMQVGDILEWTGSYVDAGVNHQMMVDLYYGTGDDYISIRPSQATLIHSRIDGITRGEDPVVPLSEGETFTYTLERTSTQYITSVNGSELFRHNFTGVVTLYGFGDISHRFEGNLESAKITNGSLIHNWSPDDSDRNASGQPTLVDTVAGNNANGAGFVEGGSAWVDLGGAGSSATFDFSFDTLILSSATKDHDIRTQILASQTKDVSIDTAILGYAVKDIDVQTAIYESATKDLDLRTQILTAQNLDFNFQTQILTSNNKSFEVQTAILTNASKTISFDTQILGYQLLDVDIRSNILGYATKDFAVWCAVDGDIASVIPLDAFTFSVVEERYSIETNSEQLALIANNPQFTLTAHDEQFTFEV